MPRYRLEGYGLSLAAHGALLVIAAAVVSRSPADSAAPRPAPAPRMVWAVPGPGSIGGGPDENIQAKTEPRPTGKPASRTASKDSPPRERAFQPRPSPVLPSPPVATGLVDTVGAVTGTPGVLTVGDPEDGPGRGGGRGSGIGTETGHRHGGGGDDGVLPGNGVSWPRLVREVKPNYTGEAMRAQVEGMVTLEIVVLADGSVGHVRIVRSLDSRFGLDQEAIKAVRAWRFEPGRRLGKAIPVRVGVELSFNLR